VPVRCTMCDPHFGHAMSVFTAGFGLLLPVFVVDREDRPPRPRLKVRFFVFTSSEAGSEVSERFSETGAESDTLRIFISASPRATEKGW